MGWYGKILLNLFFGVILKWSICLYKYKNKTNSFKIKENKMSNLVDLLQKFVVGIGFEEGEPESENSECQGTDENTLTNPEDSENKQNDSDNNPNNSDDDIGNDVQANLPNSNVIANSNASFGGTPQRYYCDKCGYTWYQTGFVLNCKRITCTGNAISC
jgi:regulatory protein YycI of two-component signal transduction system YycFG